MTGGASNGSSLQGVLAHLKGVKGRGDAYVARCPAHDDRTPSLSVSVGKDGRVLLNCHAGCAVESVLAAIGLEKRDLFPAPEGAGVAGPPKPSERPRLVATYDYHDEEGVLLFQSCRFEPKTFRQRKPDEKGGWVWSLNGARVVPYHLPAILKAVAQNRVVFVVEGEKDADLLAGLGYAATTNPMGAGKWRDEFSAYFRGGRAIILPDNDEPGRAHAQSVAASLHAHGCTVRVVELPNLPEKGDVSDWFRDGHDDDELRELIGKARNWSPDPTAKTRWRLDELIANDEIMRPPPAVVPRLAWGSRSTMIASQEKAGKSTLAGYVAARVSRGESFLDQPCQLGDVLIIGLEEFIGDVARRLVHFNADPTKVHVIDRLPLDPRKRPEELREHVAAVKPTLMIVDTLMAYSEGAVNDATKSSQMQVVVQGLTRMAHELGPALMLMHHSRRSDQKYRDSSAIGGGVDVIVEIFVPDDDADPMMRRVRARGRVPVHDFQFRFTGHGYTLDDGASVPLDQRIITLVRNRPGVSLADVREVVVGRAETINKMVMQMLSDGRLLNTGTSSRMKLVTPASQPQFPTLSTEAGIGGNRPGTGTERYGN